MIEFQASMLYTLNLDVRIGNVPSVKLRDSLRKDGRKLGNFAEQILLSEFSNLVSSPNGNSKFDLLELPKAGGARSWEVKTVSEGNACSFVASKHKGAGRKFDESEHTARQSNLTGYIVFDVSRFPQVRCKGFEVEALQRLGCVRAMSRGVLEKELAVT